MAHNDGTCAMDTSKPSRRVYKPELQQRTGFGATWIRTLEKSGRIPPGRTDPGGKRKFWLEYEVDAVVRGEYEAAA